MKFICSTTIFFFSLLSPQAMAETYKCTDAQGKISYTNTKCQDDANVQNVKDSTSVLDRSEERSLVANELARAKAKMEETKENDPEIAEGANRMAADMEKLKQADSLIHTAITTRERLWLAAVILIAVAAIFLFISRRFRKANKLPKQRDLPIPR